jgi:hypothetical protein
MAAITTTPTGLAIVAPGTTPFPPTSRYYTITTGQYTAPDGRIIVYLNRRFVPPADRFTTLEEHVVTQGERLDNITAQTLGDPLQFWRVCDANNAMRPDELTETIGRSLRITLPEGIAKAQQHA